MKKTNARRGGALIMARLVVLLGSLAYIMALAVVNGSVGYLCAWGVTLLGAIGIAKVLGEAVALSYGAIIFLAILCGVLRGVLRYFEQYSNHYIAFRLLARLRELVFSALRRLCPAKLEGKKKGSIIAMITSDIETLEVFYAHTLSPVCIAVIVSVCVFIFTLRVSNAYIALTALAGYVTVGVILPAISSARLREHGVRYRAEFSSFNAYYLDSIKGIRDTVLRGNSVRREEEIARRSAQLLGETKKLRRKTAAAAAATELTVSTFILLTLCAGTVSLAHGTLSIGRMLIALCAVFGSFGPVIAISALPGNLTQTLAAGDRVLDLLEEKPASEPVENGKAFDFESLRTEALSFGYGGGEPVLKNVNMHIERGEIVGIVGSSGCGKSTLLKLLLRFWQADRGKILYNGTDIEEIDGESLLSNVTSVSQTTYLFDDTIEENLRIAKPDATREELERACRMASVHELIASLPDGYLTKVGTLGDRLSAGERQRIGLARAFLRESPLILLDEPTSNIDSINEGIILGALKAQKKSRAMLLVSHRESTMSIADRVYRFENGVLYEQKQ